VPVDHFSAGELESFSYCPLSWYLGTPQNDSPLKSGTEEHERLNVELMEAGEEIRKASMYGNMVMYYAIVSSILSVIAISLLNFSGKYFLSRILIILAVIWIIIALTMIIIRSISGFRTLPERIVVYFTCAAIVFAVLSVTVLNSSRFFSIAGIVASLVWLMGATGFLQLELNAETHASGIYRLRGINGNVVYLGDARSTLLTTNDGKLTGRPDYIIERNGKLYPVEFKSGRVPEGPLFSHIVQLAAYCRLVEDSYGIRPDAGYIHYRDRSFEIEYNRDMENIVNLKLEEMRKVLEKGEAHRNHNRPGKCKNCSRRDICPERLV